MLQDEQYYSKVNEKIKNLIKNLGVYGIKNIWIKTWRNKRERQYSRNNLSICGETNRGIEGEGHHCYNFKNNFESKWLYF